MAEAESGRRPPHAILSRVAEDATIRVGELAGDLGVSEMTIRRDIRRLERDGFDRQTTAARPPTSRARSTSASTHGPCWRGARSG